MLRLIVALSQNNAIGCHGMLPWRQSADLKRFKELTMNNAMIMGRKTYNSIGRPLPGRKSIVLTHQRRLPINAYDDRKLEFVHNWRDAIEKAQAFNPSELPFVIGGAEIFNQAMPLVSEIYLTRIEAEVLGDTYLQIPAGDWLVTKLGSFPSDAENQFPYSFEHLVRKPSSHALESCSIASVAAALTH